MNDVHRKTNNDLTRECEKGFIEFMKYILKRG